MVAALPEGDQQGKLELPMAPLGWLRSLEQRYQLTELAIDSALAAAAAVLPPRFIIAGAQRLRVPVVTIDEKFAPYGVEAVS